MERKTIELYTQEMQLEKGESCSKLYESDLNIPFQCLEGRCGRCIIKLLKGNLGNITPSEEKYMSLLGLEVGKYRLLCQCTLEENSVIERIT